MTCGRRWGKTKAACAEAIKRAVQIPKAVIWWIAPTYGMAMIGWRQIHDLLPIKLTQQVNVSERWVELPNLSRIWVKSADNPDSLRGEGLDMAILDEAAFIKEDAWTAAIRPALADKQGRGVFISTPLGRNWFWRVFLQGQDDEQAEWKSWTFHTADNPYIPASEIDAARQDMPERIFRQEFLAEFIEDAGAVFRKVAEAATAEPRDYGAEVFGVDWGKHDDFTCIAALDSNGVMVGFDRFNQIEYAFQAKRLKGMAARYQPRTIVAELNAMGEPIAEQLRRDGLPVVGFQTTAPSKAEVIEALSLAFEKGEIKILPEPVLVNELQAFEMERLPRGAFRYGAPQGLHDDSVIALALAWWGLTQWRIQRSYKPGVATYV